MKYEEEMFKYWFGLLLLRTQIINIVCGWGNIINIIRFLLKYKKKTSNF